MLLIRKKSATGECAAVTDNNEEGKRQRYRERDSKIGGRRMRMTDGNGRRKGKEESGMNYYRTSLPRTDFHVKATGTDDVLPINLSLSLSLSLCFRLSSSTSGFHCLNPSLTLSLYLCLCLCLSL